MNVKSLLGELLWQLTGNELAALMEYAMSEKLFSRPEAFL